MLDELPQSPVLPHHKKYEEFMNLGESVLNGKDEGLIEALVPLDKLLLDNKNLEWNNSDEITKIKLKNVIDRSRLDLFRDYLTEMKALDEKIETLELSINKAKSVCNAINKELSGSREKFQKLAKDIKIVENEEVLRQDKHNYITKFLKQYTLSKEDQEYLKSKQVDLYYLALIEKLNNVEYQIQLLKPNDTRGLLTQELINLITGLRQMTEVKLNDYLELHFPKLEWNNTDFLTNDLIMKKIIKLLIRDTVRLKDLMNKTVKLRSPHLVRAFSDALQYGNIESGILRPIDLAAPDPLRYIGDIMAYVHQCLVEEKQWLFIFFSANNDNQFDKTLNQDLDDSSNTDIGLLILNLLDQLFGTLLPLLVGRINSVLDTLESPSLAFQVLNLIQFYTHLLSKNLNPLKESRFMDALKKLSQDANSTFHNILQDDMEQLLAQADVPNTDLSVPDSVVYCLEDLKRILDLYTTSLMKYPSSEANEFEGDSNINRLLDAIIHPLIQLCEREASYVNSHEKSIYIVNCLLCIQSSLNSFEITKARAGKLQPIIDENLNQLIHLQAESLLNLTGLIDLLPYNERYHQLLLDLMKEEDPTIKLNEFLNELLTSSPSTSLQKLENFLYTVDLDADFINKSSQDGDSTQDGDFVGLKRLRMPARAVWSLRSKAVELLLITYKEVYPMLLKLFTRAKELEDDNIREVNSLLRLRLRSVEELETLLYIPDL